MGTVISQMVSVAYFLSYYLRRRGYLRLTLRAMWPRPRILGEIYSVGVSSFARTIAGSISAVIINRVLLLYGGDLAISAFGIMNRLAMFAIMPSMAIGQGLQPILGYNYGARRRREALRSIWMASVAATVCCLAVFSVLQLFPGPLIRVFTDDPELLVLAARASRKMFLALYLVGFAIVGSVTFQAMGKPVQSFITAVARPLLFMIPSVLILSQSLGTDGVWVSFPLTDILTFLLTLVLVIPQLRRFHREARAQG